MRRLLALALILLAGCTPELPDFSSVREAYRPSEAYLLDRRGELLHVSRMDLEVRRLAWTALDDVSPALERAVLAAEDRRFRVHHGVDWRAFGASAFDFLTGKRDRGASTITMQVVARVEPALEPEGGRRSVLEKTFQMRAALALERGWTKPEILEAYLNLVDFRGELAGIAAGAMGLFGKAPSGIDQAEAALLAALLKSPNAPHDRVVRRACTIARRAAFDVACPRIETAWHDATARLIRPAAAYAPHVARSLLRAPGERMTTTLDRRVQVLTHAALAAQLRELEAQNVRDGAAVVLDNATGDVLAWVGSAGPHSRSPHVDGVRARRQAGSTLKPFLYGLALERRYLTAASLLDDSPVALQTGNGLYIPQNYDHAFKGSVSVRAALAGSLNVPAVRTLVLVGVEPFRDRLRDVGYRSIAEPGEFYGFSLALGSAEVSLLEQANAYRMLANGGRLTPVRLRPGGTNAATAVMSEGAAFVIADILSDRTSRAPAFGLDNALTTRYWSAVKTGTSKDMRDNWCIGFTRRFTVAVWMGNFEGDGMHDVSGVTGAAPAWITIMNALHRNEVADPPPPADDVVARSIAYSPPIEPPRREWFLPGTEMTIVQAANPVHRPRIVSPPDGAIIALDPDIPEPNQRIHVTARARPETATFELDGEHLGSAAAPLTWLPVPGEHVLRLRGQDATLLDEVHFRVRSPARGR